MHTVCTLYVDCVNSGQEITLYYVYTLYNVNCTLYVYCLYTVYTLYVHCTLINVRRLYKQWAGDHTVFCINTVYTAYTLCVHTLYIQSTLFAVCTLYKQWAGEDIEVAVFDLQSEGSIAKTRCKLEFMRLPVLIVHPHKNLTN